jgi:hypothetical protein
VFTYTPNVGNTATTVAHWINGTLAATISENEVTSLGGLIIGSNGGSPFSKLPVEIAEIAVYSKSLDGTEITELDNRWSATWGTPPVRHFPHKSRRLPARSHASGHTRFWKSPSRPKRAAPLPWQVSISIFARASREVSAPGESMRERVTILPPHPWLRLPGDHRAGRPVLNLSLPEDTTRIYLTAIPARHATLGSTIDAAVETLNFSGAQTGDVIPINNDPAGSLTLALVPLFSDVRTSGEGGVITYRIPGIVCDTDGVLHSVYDHRYTGGSDLPANVDVGYSRSTDGGATWSSSQVILDFDAAVPNSSGNGVGDPCILHDPVTDTLWVAALWSFGNNGYNGSGAGTDPAHTGQYVLTKSTDGGLTWSPPINITTAVKDDINWRLVFQGPGHGLAMRNGTLVFPSQYRDSTGTVRVCSVFSNDHGATWDFGSGVPTASPQTNENTVCELDDGRLLFSMRTPSGSNGQRAWIRYAPGGAEPMRNGSWEPLPPAQRAGPGLPRQRDPVDQHPSRRSQGIHRLRKSRQFVVAHQLHPARLT